MQPTAPVPRGSLVVPEFSIDAMTPQQKEFLSKIQAQAAAAGLVVKSPDTLDENFIARAQSELAMLIGPIEDPFGWNRIDPIGNEVFGMSFHRTHSFEALRRSKYLAYFPFLGTGVGLIRLWKSFDEFLIFNYFRTDELGDKEKELPIINNRIGQWALRGVLESIPVLGGLTCLITDWIATKTLQGKQS